MTSGITFFEKYLLHNNVRGIIWGGGDVHIIGTAYELCCIDKLNIWMFYNFARKGMENSVNKYVKICETIE